MIKIFEKEASEQATSLLLMKEFENKYGITSQKEIKKKFKSYLSFANQVKLELSKNNNTINNTENEIKECKESKENVNNENLFDIDQKKVDKLVTQILEKRNKSMVKQEIIEMKQDYVHVDQTETMSSVKTGSIPTKKS